MSNDSDDILEENFKFQEMLLMLSRLRNLETETKQEILAMPLHYDVENDGLYLEGIEKGASETLRNVVIRMLQMGEFSKEKIALMADVDIGYVNDLQKSLLSGTPGDLK